MLLSHDPKEIGGIQILDRLGSGGAGIVYKGRDKDNQIVALKILHAEFANNQTVRKRLEREADAMRSVKGNRTVKVRRIEIDVVQPFIVMDFAEGENLANYIANIGVLKGQALNDFALQLAEAIRDIHKAKVIHRDLKPTNVIIGPDGLKVVDFGISIVSEVTGMTQTGILSGTASWLSPEQILGKDITEKTDIFNYGLVLGFAATGKHLFGEGKPEAVMFRILNTVPELNLLSRKMQTIIKDLISKDPSKRPDTIKNLAIIKETFLTTNETESMKSNKIQKLFEKKEQNRQEVKHKNQLNRKLIIGAISLFSVLSIFFLIYFANNSQQNNNVLVQQELNNNVIKKQESTTSPTPNNSQSQPSTIPSKTETFLDDEEIIGNIISFDEGIWFTSFKDSFNKENIGEDFDNWWFYIFDDVPLSDENLLQIKEKISDSPRIEFESGGSWINYPNQLFTCPDFNRACWITLGDIYKKFTKSYSKSTNINLRVIIPNQDLYPFQKLYRKNMEIIKIDIVPATCQDASNQMIKEGYTKNESINMLTNPIYGIC